MQKTKILVVSTSQRANSESHNIASQIATSIRRLDQGTAVEVYDLATVNLPFFDPASANTTKLENDRFFNFFRDAHGIVLVSPEWDGMASPAAKNLTMYLTKGEIAHKAGLLVSLSSQSNGAYPISELRSSSYKNTFINWIPIHLIFRTWPTALDSDVNNLPQCGPTLRAFLCYCKGLTAVRQEILDVMRGISYGM